MKDRPELPKMKLYLLMGTAWSTLLWVIFWGHGQGNATTSLLPSFSLPKRKNIQSWLCLSFSSSSSWTSEQAYKFSFCRRFHTVQLSNLRGRHYLNLLASALGGDQLTMQTIIHYQYGWLCMFLLKFCLARNILAFVDLVFNFDHCQPDCTSDWGIGFANFWREIQSNINYIELGFELDQVIH